MTSTLLDELQAIYDEHDQLTPVLVLDVARAPEHPLHDRFEWDDQIAGEAWRRDQAHQLIRSVRVTYRTGDEHQDEHSVRAFHSVRNEDGYGYHPAQRVVADPFTARLVLADMEREWRALKRRYDEFEQFWRLVSHDIPEAA